MILKFLATVVIVYVLGGLLGYVVHWWFHQPWSGRFYRLHKTHHDKMYPASDFLSDTYRDAGADNTTPWFTAVLVAVMAPSLFLLWTAGLPGWIVVLASVEATAIGLLNNWLHDSLHIRGHFLERYRSFRVWRTAHRVHHANVRFNLGIFTFGWDRLLGTFRKPHVNE